MALGRIAPEEQKVVNVLKLLGKLAQEEQDASLAMHVHYLLGDKPDSSDYRADWSQVRFSGSSIFDMVRVMESPRPTSSTRPTPRKAKEPARLNASRGVASAGEVESLRVLLDTIVQATEPFRRRYRQLLSALEGRGFGEKNHEVVELLNLLNHMLGFQFADPTEMSRSAALRYKNNGQIELRALVEGKLRSRSCRNTLPDKLPLRHRIEG